MRAGIIVDNEFSNDIRVLREAEILREDGIEVNVLCFGYVENYNNKGFNITRIKISRKLKNFLFFFMNILPVYEWMWIRKIRKFIVSTSPDVLHVHDLYMARAAFRGIKNSGRNIRFILDLHENYPYTVTTYNWTKGFPRRMLSRPYSWTEKEQEYLGYADNIIVLSESYKTHLETLYPSLKGRFIAYPNVPDISKWKDNGTVAPNPFNNGFPVIFYYGVIAERRGIFDSLEVFVKLVNENHCLNFLIIGPVDKKDSYRFMNYVTDTCLKGRIHYIPWIDSKELPSYLRLADICLAPFHKNPQHESGIANKIFEYMAGEKPLVVSDCRPQRELIEEARCGFVFKNMQEFHDDLIKLIENSQLRSQLGKNGRNAIELKYNQRYFRKYLSELYK
ncbi:MAG TPA: glycosyltransferase family 4 protein [Bacteroidales bacterium]|nr:glycosyltransferase family 4 protein [Bacteroidales bacterium]